MKTPRVIPRSLLWPALLLSLAYILYLVGYELDNAMVGYYFRVLLLCGIAITAAVSLNIINGFTGQFSIGHAGFMLVGAYASAGITVFSHQPVVRLCTALHIPASCKIPFLALHVVRHTQEGAHATTQHLFFRPLVVAPQTVVEFGIALAAGAFAAAVVGILVGLPSLRLRGDYLAIATLGFGEGIRGIFVTIDAVGGASGLHNIPRYTSFVWVFLFVVGVVIVARNLALSTHGRALFAIREDEVAAQAVGVDTFRYKMLAFLIAAAWAGVAGALLAHLDQGISPQSYGFMKSVEIVVMVVLGGLGSIIGAVIAAFALTALPEILRPVAEYRMVFYSALLILLMLLRPKGLLGRKEFGLPFLGILGIRKGARK